MMLPQMRGLSGVYEIVHSTSGKRYVGSAVKFGSRWSVHRHHLERGTHHCSPLQNAWKKYGEASFSFRPLLVCDREHLVEYEQACIDALRPSYNVCPKAGNSLGYRHTDETKAAFRFRKKAGRSDETRRRLSEANKGKVITGSQREAIAASLRGKKHSDDRRAKQSAVKVGKLNTGRSKPVRCIETGSLFPSCAEAARWLQQGRCGSVDAPYIAASAGGKFTSAYGYTWVFA